MDKAADKVDDEAADELAGEPDPDFACLPDNYGEDDAVRIHRKDIRLRIAAQLDLLLRYHEATDNLEGKSGVIGRRRSEPEEVEAIRQELLQMGVQWVDGVPHLAG